MNLDDSRMMCGLLFGALLVIGSVTPASAIVVSPLHGSEIHVNSGSGLTSAYVGYSLTNDDGFDHLDIWVRLEGFVGPAVAPAAMEDAVYHLGRLDAGETRPAYFYLTVSGPPMGAETHTVAVYAGPPEGPPLVAPIFPLITEEALGASVNKIRQIVSLPDAPVIGGEIVVTVVGETGVVGDTGDYAISPAVDAAWPADAFELMSVQTTFMDPDPDCTVPLFSTVDELAVTLSPGLEYCYESTYRFRVRGEVAGVTPISPIAYVSSGAQIKYEDLDCLTSVDCDIGPTTNSTTIEKSASAESLPGAGTVSYTLALDNTAASSVTVDGLTDRLPVVPGAASYLAGTATYGGTPIGDPIQAADELIFVGPFVVPASGSASLGFDVELPATPGIYVNTAVGAIGSVQIDATLATGDDVPAEAAIAVGASLPGLMGPGGLGLVLVFAIAGGRLARRRWGR